MCLGPIALLLHLSLQRSHWWNPTNKYCESKNTRISSHFVASPNLTYRFLEIEFFVEGCAMLLSQLFPTDTHKRIQNRA